MRACPGKYKCQNYLHTLYDEVFEFHPAVISVISNFTAD